MKTFEFKKLIKEAVKEALIEIFAHTPSTSLQEQELPTSKMEEHSIKRSHNNADPITAMINETKASMTSEEYKNILNVNSSIAPTFFNNSSQQPTSTYTGAGIDITNLSFVKKAKQVLEIAEQKDKFRHGV